MRDRWRILPRMDPHLLRVFESRVEEQCVTALQASQDLIDAVMGSGTNLPASPRSEGFGPPDRAVLLAYHRAVLRSSANIWWAAQSFVVAVGNLSKLLWGEKGSLAVQRKPLRDALNVGGVSLLQPTSMRNHFEHFDERIDRWWANSPGHNMIDMSLGPISIGGNVSGVDFFRGFDPDSGNLSFWGDNMNVPDVCDELRAILKRVEAELDKPITP